MGIPILFAFFIGALVVSFMLFMAFREVAKGANKESPRYMLYRFLYALFRLGFYLVVILFVLFIAAMFSPDFLQYS